MDRYPHPACLDTQQLALECEFTRTRRGGPGGQHRNKVETAVVVTHRPTGILAQASERRSQHENRAMALQRLRINLAIGYRLPAADIPTHRSTLWVARCQGGKISVNHRHEDFPALLAEALDAVNVAEFQMSAAADSMKCSTSQLIKLIKTEMPALQWVNQQRNQREMGPLK